MYSALVDSLSYIIRGMLSFLIVLLLLILLVYWSVWSWGKGCVDRACTDIQTTCATKGALTDAELDEIINKYCSNSGAFVCIVKDTPNSYINHTEPEYIGDPTYVDFTVRYKFYKYTLNIPGHVDNITSIGYGRNGRGYLTINETY